MMKYQQLTLEERLLISHLRKQGFNQSEIARQMGRHRSTISRELSRNSYSGVDFSYRYSRADREAVARRRRSRRNRHYTERDFAIVRRFLRKEWSPEQIVGIIRRFKLMKRHMRQSIKQRRKRYGAYDSRPASVISPNAPDRSRRATSEVTGRSIRS